MPGKKPRRLPEEEDLAASVADMINSPITRANLSFLNTAAPAPAIEGIPESKPMGFDSKPEGFNLRPVALQAARPITAALYTSSSQDSRPAGIVSTPMGLGPASPSPSQAKALWQAEALGNVFEPRRVRRISQAQDALSLVEERVYDLLWGTRNFKKEEFRLVHYSLQRIASEARINIKTVRELVPRLIDKGFIEVEAPADPKGNRPTLYKVYSYCSVLAGQRRRNRLNVVKTGKGVFYVHPVSATLQEDDSEPMGFELRPMGVTPMGFISEPVGDGSTPTGVTPPPPMGAGSSKPMGSSGYPSLDNTEDSKTTSTSWTALIEIIRENFGVEPDSDILAAMMEECRERALESDGSPATLEELIYFTRIKAQILARAGNIRNHVAVLRKALPQCFTGEAFRIFRRARSRRREQDALELQTPGQFESEHIEAQRRHAHWTEISERHKTEAGTYDMTGIAGDPDLDQQGRLLAQARVQKLGRFTPEGL